MRHLVDEYKGHKIWVDETGQFWTGEQDTKHFWNVGTSVRTIKEEFDFLEAYEKAKPVKVLRIEYPYLQVWNIRQVKRKKYGYDHTAWYTKDDVSHGPDHEKVPRDFTVRRDIVQYDEALHRECERRFKEIKDHYEWTARIQEERALPDAP
jgi:hypothetical protein